MQITTLGLGHVCGGGSEKFVNGAQSGWVKTKMRTDARYMLVDAVGGKLVLLGLGSLEHDLVTHSSKGGYYLFDVSDKARKLFGKCGGDW